MVSFTVSIVSMILVSIGSTVRLDSIIKRDKNNYEGKERA